MGENTHDYKNKLVRLVQFSISKSLIDLAKADLQALEELQTNYNIIEEDFLKHRKRILDMTNSISRNLLDLMDTVFKS